MSRLDSFIRRLEAQRACLDRAGGRDPRPARAGASSSASATAAPTTICATGCRAAPSMPSTASSPPIPAACPPAGLLLLGDIRDTVPAAAARLGPAVLIHSDIGSGEAAATAALAADLAPLYAAALAPGGLLLSDQPVADPRLEAEPLPPEVPAGRYFLYRRAAG
jgi:hypothetical protein